VLNLAGMQVDLALCLAMPGNHRMLVHLIRRLSLLGVPGGAEIDPGHVQAGHDLVRALEQRLVPVL